VADDAKLVELLLKENLVSQTQLKTAVDFQKKVGGDLGGILVKLGYIKDSVLAEVNAKSENVGAAAIDATVIDLEAVRTLPRQLLEKHQVIPLKSDDSSMLVLAMADPNNLAAIEEIQFLVNKNVEPAVAPKAAIRKALNQLDEFLRQASQPAQARPAAAGAGQQEKMAKLAAAPIDRLIRAWIMIQVEKGLVSADDLITRVEKLG
jgi:hypothetical protein